MVPELMSVRTIVSFAVSIKVDLTTNQRFKPYAAGCFILKSFKIKKTNSDQRVTFFPDQPSQSNSAKGLKV